MNQLKVRCPSCEKLYQVDFASIMSTSPYFQCVSCPTTFTFDFPPTDSLKIVSRRVLPESEITTPVAMQVCSRCGHQSEKTLKECPACQVIFSKLEGLPQDPSLRAQPSLVRRWKEILSDFDNSRLHEEFVEACRRLDALAYATAQYKELNQLQGGDPICEQKLKLIEELAHKKLRPSSSVPSRMKKSEVLSAKVTSDVKLGPLWLRCLLAAPVLIGVLFVLIGLTGFAPRNMFGAGMAMTFLSLGLVAAVKGRLSLQDFVEMK